MENKYSLSDFFSEHDKLVTAYSIFLGVFVISQNVVKDSNQVITLFFLLLAFLCWSFPTIKVIKEKYRELDFSMLILVAFSSIGNLTILADSIFRTDQIPLTFIGLTCASVFTLSLSTKRRILLSNGAIKNNRINHFLNILFMVTALFFVIITGIYGYTHLLPYTENLSMAGS